MGGWLLRYEGFDPAAERLREALCAVGNGRFVTRAAAPERRADAVHYPGTYAAGVFNRLTDQVAGQRVENESVVNLPDWQSLTFRIDDGEWLDLRRVAVSGYVQELDLRRGVLTRRFRMTDPAGRRTTVAQRRLVSMADPYLAVLETTVVAEDWSGRLTVRSGLDGRVENRGVPRYAGLRSRHLVPERACVPDGADGVLGLVVETSTSRTRIGLAARHRVTVDGRLAEPATAPVAVPDSAAVDLTVELAAGGRATVEKTVALCTSRDHALAEPGDAAREQVGAAGDVEQLLGRHVLAWRRLWNRCDVEIDGSPRAALVLRLHVFHLLQTLSPHSADLDVGIGRAHV